MPLGFGCHRSQKAEKDARASSKFFDLQDDRPSLPFPVGHRLLHTLEPLTLRLSLCGDLAPSREVKQSAIAELSHVFDLLNFWCREFMDQMAALDEDVKNSAPTTADRAVSAVKCYSLLLKQIPPMQRALLVCKPEAYKAGWGQNWEDTFEAFSNVDKKMRYFDFPSAREALEC